MSNAVENKAKTGPVIDRMAGKYLSFFLSKEEYGIEILRVREIIGIVDITPLPKTAPYVKGVINLRGKIIPVIDLRLRFGMPKADYTNETCIVVVEVAGDAEGQPLQTGCIVDTVCEVLSVENEQLEAAPRCANTSGEHIAGLAKLKDRVLIVLDIERVVGSAGIPRLAEQG